MAYSVSLHPDALVAALQSEGAAWRAVLIDRAFQYVELYCKVALRRDDRRMYMDSKWRPGQQQGGPAEVALQAARQAAEDLQSAVRAIAAAFRCLPGSQTSAPLAHRSPIRCSRASRG